MRMGFLNDLDRKNIKLHLGLQRPELIKCSKCLLRHPILLIRPYRPSSGVCFEREKREKVAARRSVRAD